MTLSLMIAFLASSPLPIPETLPNILFILADDLGYGDVRCYNADSKIPTPHIDALANKGMRLTDAHSPGALCVPSRYGLLTGRYPCRARLDVGRRSVIEDQRGTLASMLKARGYRTSMVGKWHLGFDAGGGTGDIRGGPLDRGFDAFFGIPASLDIPPYYYIRGREAVAPPAKSIDANATSGWSKIQGAFWREGKIAEGFRHEEVLPKLGEEAKKVIDEHHQSDSPVPFFLYLALTAPHTPWLPSEGSRDRSKASLYGDFVCEVDDIVGALVETLERHRILDDTLIVFTSDNGPVWYPTDVDRLGHRSCGELRGMKADAWEGGHRVPFIARWTDKIPSGSIDDALFGFVDVMATLAAITDSKLPSGAGEDSVDQSAVLFGTAAKPPRTQLLIKNKATVIREGHWKLITHLGSGGFSKPRKGKPQEGGPQGQLYNLSVDLGETENLWSREPEVVARLLDIRDQVIGPGDTSGK